MTNFLEILKKLLRLKNHWNIKKFEAETYPRAQKVMAVRWTWKKLSFQANSEKNTHLILDQSSFPVPKRLFDKGEWTEHLL